MTNTFFSRLRAHHATQIVIACFVAITTACGGDSVNGPSTDGNPSAYWFLRLNHHFANLATVAPHNTIQLTATPQTLDGTTYQTELHSSFASTNQAVLQVDSTGLVTALQSGVAMIVATLKIDNIIHQDTITIGVHDGPAPQVSRIAVELSPSWIYPISREASVMYTVTAFDANDDTVKVQNVGGNDVPLDLITNCTVSNPLVGQCLGIRSGLQYVIAKAAGKTTATFSSYIFGTAMSDSVELTVEQSLFVMITLGQVPITAGTGITFSPASAVIAPGGVFLFVNSLSQPTDVIFEDSTVVKEANPDMGYYYFYPPDGSGNIINLPVEPDFGWEPKGARTIYEPGTYRYRNPETGATGVIIVKAQ